MNPAHVAATTAINIALRQILTMSVELLIRAVPICCQPISFILSGLLYVGVIYSGCSCRFFSCDTQSCSQFTLTASIFFHITLTVTTLKILSEFHFQNHQPGEKLTQPLWYVILSPSLITYILIMEYGLKNKQ